MVLAAPELVIAEPVELLDKVEIAAELQHRMLADRMMRGEKGTEAKAGHGGFSWQGRPRRGERGEKAVAESYSFDDGMATARTSRNGGVGVVQPFRLADVLLGHLFRMHLQPQGIGAKVESAGPFETAPALPYAHSCKEPRVGEGGENALPGKVAEAINSRLAICPGQYNGMAGRIGCSGDNDVIASFRHHYAVFRFHALTIRPNVKT